MVDLVGAVGPTSEHAPFWQIFKLNNVDQRDLPIPEPRERSYSSDQNLCVKAHPCGIEEIVQRVTRNESGP